MSDERWLERVAHELKAPVSVTPGFEAGVRAAIIRSRRTRRIAWSAGGIVVAVAAALLLFLRPVAGPERSARATEVEFAIDLPAASAVSLVGDFNDWDRARTPLVRDGGSSRWTARLSLAGGLYHYAYLVDGVQWVADPRQPAPLDNDYGQSVSLLAVAQ